MAINRTVLGCSIILLVPIITLGVLVWLGNSPAQASPSILYVGPGANCGGAIPCFPNVQNAVDAAQPGDEIRVASGTYTGYSVRPKRDTTTSGVVTQTVYISKTVTIRGGYNSSFSSWDPDHFHATLHIPTRGRGIYITGVVSPTIEWLRITGGDAAGLGGLNYYGPNLDAGGGIYVTTATATLNNNEVFGNSSAYGGGVFLGKSASQLNHNIIYNNHADSVGGGVVLYRATRSFEGNTISYNTSSNVAGGVYAFYFDAAIQGNTIAGNSASANGGGLLVASCSPPLTGNIFYGNTARLGGGVSLGYSHSIFTNNVLVNNRATSFGRGSALNMEGSDIRMFHNTLARNQGGDGSGVYVTLQGSTFSTLAMTNTLMISHTVGISITSGSSTNLNGVLWYGTPITISGAVVVQHQYLGNPAFQVDGYHLRAESAAIDKGVQTGVSADMDGEMRYGFPDLGADEYWPFLLYLPLIRRGP
jgi:hypothetical protein